MSAVGLVCASCGRTYPVEQEHGIDEGCPCCRMGVKAEEENLSPDARFNTVLQKFSRRLSPHEVDLIQEMHTEGVINTLWLRRNYQLENITASEDVEVVEKAKPLIFDHYQALQEIGEGGMGIVYKGRDMVTGETVAIKRLHPERVGDGHARIRFLRELNFLKELSHPNILPLLDGGEQNGEYFLVTLFIEDGSLEKRMKELPPKRHFNDVAPLFAILLQIGQALAYAHAMGLIHRDVKPANILLDGDYPYLADFGLAKQLGVESPQLTQGAVGTPCYMAPELWQKKTTPQVDIYSLGVILYEIVTGEYPFPGDKAEEILVKQLSTRPRSPHFLNPYLPSSLNGIILKALARDPQKRHACVQEFVDELAQILV